MINRDILAIPELLSSNYVNAHPYPYIVFDNFLQYGAAGSVCFEMEGYNNWSTDETDHVADHQQNKFYTPHSLDLDDRQKFRDLAPVTNMVLDYMYSPEALSFLERLTGIKNLKGDPELLGGGVHKITRGGRLGIHADFNRHFRSNLWRRINVLIYLNQYWDSSWGGDLELWSKDLKQCCVKVEPIFNRAAIFTITDEHYHGHPHPLNTPEERSRYSLALYYYTEDRPEEEKADFHPVLWKTT